MEKDSLILQGMQPASGIIFGARRSVSGEVVFCTGMVGYPESLTDPSYCGQILLFTQPMIGNYGVPPYEEDEFGLQCSFESEKIQVRGVIIADLSEQFSHYTATRSLSDWLKSEDVPGITGVDTRALTRALREKGTVPGKIVYNEEDVEFFDPGASNIVPLVSCKEPRFYGNGDKSVILLDCGVKANIIRSLLQRGISVKVVPWDYAFTDELASSFDGLVIANGPGDPKMLQCVVENISKSLQAKKPIFGICLGNQLIALAAGFDTYKMPYGHRSQNQPAVELTSGRCLITSQNHGYAVSAEHIPDGWNVWFENANDGTVEGIRHKSLPFRSVQFHPEATPGPLDAGYLFDEFVGML